ncbi:MAG TPA: potassium transporter TrkG, partial [Planctomycetota bacterium]|nr:potassium transporter TrkG [Planctomycetota bacterium]
MPDSGLGPRPAHRLILGYLVAIATGALLLWSPWAAAPGREIAFVDAVFTATSAVSVTGLSTVDTGTCFSPFGQLVILLLLQLGGLGVMTFSTFLLLGVSGRASMAVREATGEPLGAGSGQRLGSTLRGVFLLTLAFEAAGALLLFATWTFGDGYPADRDWLARAWDAIFHSCAAFCNAGFSTFSDNLAGFQGCLATNLIIMVLIVAGGLGFVSLLEIGRGAYFLRKGSARRISSHTRMALTVSAVLIVGGALLIYLLERGRTLEPLGEGDRVLASFFQSVTARTAGFNTLNIGAMAAPTLFLLIVLMFVGASPCGTGGGIKTTTLGVLMATAWARIRGKGEAQCFGRSVPHETVVRAAMLTILSAAIIGVVLLAFLGTEPAENLGSTGEEGGFLRASFEAVSAFGTVGLSTGVTAKLSALGKLLIAALMFIGRVGPLSLGIALSRP